MNDTNAFVNAYIDNSIGMLHEQMSSILQLKTQLKVTNDIVAEKDRHIQTIMAELDNLKSSTHDIESLRERCRALDIKVSHMDTLMNQFKEIKQTVIQKDKTIEDLEKKLNKLSASYQDSKVIINTKDKKVKTSLLSKTDTKDDF
jgi:DNA repair exonuclease SbcCD ATPase subunit